MKSTLCGLVLIGVFSTADCLSSANLHEELSRSVSIDSAAVVADVGGRGQMAGVRLIAKRPEESQRIGISGSGVTLMEGASLNDLEASASDAQIIRREDFSSGHHSAGDAASALRVDAVQTTHKAKRTKAVTWVNCVAGECNCGPKVNGRDVVIRYHREHGAAPDNAGKANVMFNWHWQQQHPNRSADRAHTHMKGFTTNAINLQACGGTTELAEDCTREPETCAFDATNPYDAKAGQYCCNADFGYCSYKCKGDEVFACTSLTAERNFPGGLDPAGPDVIKKCYIAQYPSNTNPEVAEDSLV